ncbi:hypothetical protein ABIE58_003923, partial [Roseovarius sp. MBR-78]
RIKGNGTSNHADKQAKRARFAESPITASLTFPLGG